MAFLKLSSVSKKGEGEFELQDISFSLKKFERLAIAGETGSGKSTVLKIIAGLVQPDAGEVLFNDERVAGPNDKLVPGHAEIAYLSQHFELPKFLRVEQILTYANSLNEDEGGIVYEICQINHLLKRNTDQLSGGEKQRIAIARLLIGSPKLLLLDEPFSHLDMVHKTTLKNVIKNIGDQLKITCVLVSHDPADMLSWAQKIIVMKDGEIVQKGSPLELYRNPLNEYVAGLFGKYNLLDPLSEFKPKRKGLETGKTLFTRPEDFQIVKKSEGGVKGVVSEVYFLGSHYELEVVFSDEVITLKRNSNDCEKGDTVYVSLANNSNWLI